jgi:membrane protease subunit HflK
MPWSDNSEAGAKPGGKPGPWGQPSSGGGRAPDNDEFPRAKNGGVRRRPPPPAPDDVGALWRRLRRQLEPLLGPRGRGLGPRVAAGAVGLVVAAWLATGFYVVQPNEQGVVSTFGAWTRTEGPGAHYHLPEPIEGVEPVQVNALRQLTIGGDDEANQALTSDNNIVALGFTVQYRINDPARYLFGTDDADDTISAVAQSAIREVVGRTDLQTLTTTGRGGVQDQARDLTQRVLDGYGAGVTIVQVQIRAANPPRELIPDVQAVASASQSAEASVNVGRTYATKAIAAAKGGAAAAIAAAQADSAKASLEAEGDAARFKALDAEYRRAPAATRERLYIETMQRVLARSNKVILDAKGSTAPIVLPPDLFKPKAATARGTTNQSAPAVQVAPAPPATSQGGRL